MKLSFIALVAFTGLASFTEAKKLTHSQATAKLSAAGIKWTSSGGCSDRNRKTCTSFTGVREETIEGAITLKKACKCALTITGGTETGHASGTYSHWNGYKLDFKKASGINSYVTSNFKRIADRGGDPQYKAKSGNLYVVSPDYRFDTSYIDLLAVWLAGSCAVVGFVCETFANDFAMWDNRTRAITGMLPFSPTANRTGDH